MIAKLTGTVEIISPSECIIDVNGVGYHLYIPFGTYETLVAGEQTALYVFTLHNENQFKLYGFATQAEREFFSLLLTISGVGPTMALAIISGITVERFTAAVESCNTGSLTKISGVGTVKAEKILFDAKRLLKKLKSIAGAGDASGETSVRNDAVDALLALGFDAKSVVASIDFVMKQTPGVSLEKAIKEALRILSA